MLHGSKPDLMVDERKNSKASVLSVLALARKGAVSSTEVAHTMHAAIAAIQPLAIEPARECSCSYPYKRHGGKSIRRALAQVRRRAIIQRTDVMSLSSLIPSLLPRFWVRSCVHFILDCPRCWLCNNAECAAWLRGRAKYPWHPRRTTRQYACHKPSGLWRVAVLQSNVADAASWLAPRASATSVRR